jgi:hypothetical protein
MERARLRRRGGTAEGVKLIHDVKEPDIDESASTGLADEILF